MDRVIILRADATPTMGTGHVMRCMALAQAARANGLDVIIVGRIEVPWVLNRLKAEKLPFIQVLDPAPSVEAPSDLLQQIDVTGFADWVILDGYHFDAECQKAVMSTDRKLLVIDDYNHMRAYYCDILLNQNIGADELCYSGHISQKLFGPRYALLRPEFSQYRGKAEQKAVPSRVEKVLLTLGGGDFTTVLRDISPAFNALTPECTLRVISGQMPAECISEILLSCPAKVEILRDVKRMPELMLWADLCVTAGGSTCWELCCMGLPFLTVEVAENQRRIIQYLEKVQLAQRFNATAFRRYMDSLDFANLRAKLLEQTDGMGAANVCNLIRKVAA